jgi:hypothetical protein
MKTEVNNTIEDVREHLNNLSNEELISLHNQYCESVNDMDSQIFNNDEEFFEVYLPKSTDAIRACQYGDHRYADNFVQFNGYANLESFDNVSDRVNHDEIASDIIENEQNYYDIELGELFTCEICDETMTEEAHDFCDVCDDCRE